MTKATFIRVETAWWDMVVIHQTIVRCISSEYEEAVCPTPWTVIEFNI